MLATNGKKTTAEIAAEVALKKRSQGERLFRQADQIKAKANAYITKSDDEELELANSWNSFLRRTGRRARWLGNKHKSPGIYDDALRLFRYIVRSVRRKEGRHSHSAHDASLGKERTARLQAVAPASRPRKARTEWTSDPQKYWPATVLGGAPQRRRRAGSQIR
jgi:hypothetical protein